MLNKRKVVKCLIIIALIIIIIIAGLHLRRTLARYETATSSEGSVDTAFWVVDGTHETQSLLINGLYPSSDTFDYTFSISNYDAGSLDTEDDDEIAETDLEYTIAITTTTNLPLSYEIQRNGTKCTNVQEELFADTDGTYYRKLSFATEEKPYPFVLNSIQDTDGDGKYTKTRVKDIYTLKVTFPINSYVNGVEVNNRANSEYADLMEDVKIELSARQIID